MAYLDLERAWQAHDFAAQMPLMAQADLERLADDIARNGVRHPVVMFQDRVLDGRNRLLAARRAGLLRVPCTNFGGDASAAWAYVISANVERRQMGDGQCASAAALMRSRSPVPIEQQEVARRFGVSDRYVRMAEQLLEHTSPRARELFDRVHAGALGLRPALRMAEADITPIPREVLIDPMPDNPAIAEEPAIATAMGGIITQGARAMMAAAGDPTAWVRCFPAGEARSLALAIEDFGRRAVDLIAEESGVPNAAAEAITAARQGATVTQQAGAIAAAVAAARRSII